MEIEKIVLICIIILIIGYFIYKFFFLKQNINSEKLEQTTDKELKYFGGDYCPFSNTDSNAYKVIKDFEDKYGNKVSVKYYWTGKDNNVMNELNIKYVPTILNGKNIPIEIELPKDTDTSKFTNIELKNMLLENIYNKL